MIGDQGAVELAPGVHWVGSLDSALRDFDVILRTANGTSYNAYCVRGSEGVAIIDTVKESHADDFFARIEQVADYAEITVIVLNHLEPDHTGALPALMRRAPQARLYISVRAQMMLKGLLKSEELVYTPVNTGDTISLGDRTLRFLHTPFLHWPDTQCTYLVEEAMLFSGDVFGCHFCDTRLFNDQVGDFRFSFEYYYQHIMRPFREHVLDALDLIEPLEIRLIAPAHGPILRDAPMSYVQRYRQLASPLLANEAAGHDKTLIIFYISAYGNTALMAQAVRQGAEEISGVRVSLYDLQGGEVSPFVDLVEEADAIVFGSPTINGDAVKPIWDLLSSLAVVNVREKLGAAFGSFGWSGEAVAMVEDRLRGLKLRVPVKGVKVKLIPTEAELALCRAFGRDLALHLTGQVTRKVISMEELNAADRNSHVSLDLPHPGPLPQGGEGGAVRFLRDS
jgi:flavorubredoxin